MKLFALVLIILVSFTFAAPAEASCYYYCGYDRGYDHGYDDGYWDSQEDSYYYRRSSYNDYPRYGYDTSFYSGYGGSSFFYSGYSSYGGYGSKSYYAPHYYNTKSVKKTKYAYW